MISVPHLMILQYIKRQMRFIRANPYFIEHALSGYASNSDLRTVFGARRIDDGIRWFQENEFNYVSAYNLDAAKLPNICVSCESTTEGTQFLGDFAGFDDCVTELATKTYLSGFIVKGVTDERTSDEKIAHPPVLQYGYPIVPGAVNIRNYVWRGLTLTDGTNHLKITGFNLAPNGIDTVVVTESMVPINKSHGKWSVVSTNNSLGYEVLSSLDQVQVKIELAVSSDPEIVEMISCVLKYVIKSGRRWFTYNNLENPKFTMSPLMKFSGPSDNPTWAVDFTISGLAKDTWYGVPYQQVEFVGVSGEAVSTAPDTEGVVFYTDEEGR